jgi:hypothetical protein
MVAFSGVLWSISPLLYIVAAESRGLTPPGLVSNDWLWFRRARFIIDALVIRSHPGRCQAETPLIAQLKFAGPAL